MKSGVNVFYFSIIIEKRSILNYITYGIRTQTRFMIYYFDLIVHCSLFFLFIWISIFTSFHGWIMSIFTSRIYIYNIYYCQEGIFLSI